MDYLNRLIPQIRHTTHSALFLTHNVDFRDYHRTNIVSHHSRDIEDAQRIDT